MIEILDWKILAPIVGAIVFLVSFFFTRSQSKKIGKLEVENLLTKKDLENLIKTSERKAKIEKEAVIAGETLNGYSWEEIQKIKQEQGLKSLSDILSYLQSLK